MIRFSSGVIHTFWAVGAPAGRIEVEGYPDIFFFVGGVIDTDFVEGGG